MVDAPRGDVSHPSFDVPALAPFAPGLSPFRVAGTVYRHILDTVDEIVPGGLDQVCERLTDARVVAFLRERFWLTSSYDAVPLPYVAHAIARARGMSVEQHLRDANAAAARRVGGLYDALTRVLSAETLAAAIPRATALVQGFGGVRSDVVGPKHVRGVRTGVPRVLVRWFACSSGAYVERAVERLGGLGARSTFGAPTRDGVVAGHDTFAVPFEVRWS